MDAVVEVVRTAFAEPPLGGVTRDGLSEQEAVDGQPLTERFTALLKPFSDPTVMLAFPLDPAVTLTALGLTASEKSAGCRTISVTVALGLPPFPVMVRE